MNLWIGLKIRQADHNVPRGDNRIKNSQDSIKGKQLERNALGDI